MDDKVAMSSEEACDAGFAMKRFIRDELAQGQEWRRLTDEDLASLMEVEKKWLHQMMRGSGATSWGSLCRIAYALDTHWEVTLMPGREE